MTTRPDGEPYDWYQRATALLESGDAGAAANLLGHVIEVEPHSAAAREALARALFDSKNFNSAVEEFRQLAEQSPDNDYAHYGLGLSLWRLQRFTEAENELAMAFVMRPTRPEYGKALAQVRATMRARAKAGMPADGPI